MRFAASLVLMGVCCIACSRPPAPAPAPPEPGAPLAVPEDDPAPAPAVDVPGFEYRELELSGSTETAPRQLAVAVADPARVRITVVAARQHPGGWQTSEIVADQSGALAVINGGYFDEEDHPLGLIIADGETVNPWRANAWPAFVVRDGRPRMVTSKESTDGATAAVQCGPWLVRDGEPTRLKESEPAERSAVGLNNEGDVLFIATRRGRPTLAEFAAALALPVADGGVGCRQAINLDGGPSTQMAVPGKVQIRGLYAMPSHLVMLPKEQP